MTYENLSNCAYGQLPDLDQIPNKELVQNLRLVAQPLTDISELQNYHSLQALNISYTQVTRLPFLPNLIELQMLEVELDDCMDLSRLPNLTRLKISNDLGFHSAMSQVEILHCAVIYFPNRLHQFFPNLKEVRFEHIHPKERIIDSANLKAIPFYCNLKYKFCRSSHTVVQQLDVREINDFNDEFVPMPDKLLKDVNQSDSLAKNIEFAEPFMSGHLDCTYDTRKFYCQKIGTVVRIYDQTIEKSIKLTLFESPLADHGKFIPYPGDTKFKERAKKMAYNGIWIGWDEYENTKTVYYRLLENLDERDYILDKELRHRIMSLELEPEYIHEEWSIVSLFYLIQQWIADGNSSLHHKDIDTLKYLVFHYNINSELRRSKLKRYLDNNLLLDSNECSTYDDLPKGQCFRNLLSGEIKDTIWLGGKEHVLDHETKELFMMLVASLNCEFHSWSDKCNVISVQELLEQTGEKELRVELINTGEGRHEINLNDDVNDSSESNNSSETSDSHNSESNPHDPYVIFSRICRRLGYSPKEPLARCYLNFYGRACNLSEKIIKSLNGQIVLGQGGDVGEFNHIDAILDRDNHYQLYLPTTFFVFKNKVYTDFDHSDKYMNLFNPKDFVVLQDGTIGWGATFYAFDIVLNQLGPHPNVMTKRDIIIESPLKYSVWTDYECCQSK